MPTAIGVDTLTSISERVVLPRIVDAVYGRNPFTFRLLAGNKRTIQGGTQIELPVLNADPNIGGWFEGYDTLDTAAFDVVSNAVWDWKELSVPVQLSRRDLIKANTTDAIANLIRLQFDIAEKRLAELLATAIWALETDTNAKSLDSVPQAIDTADPTKGAYGNIARSGNTYWQAVEDGSTTTTNWANVNANFMSAVIGAYAPTILLSRVGKYLKIAEEMHASGYKQINVPVGGADELLLSSGFTNILFNNIPWVVDDKVPSANHVYGLNEDTWELAVTPLGDFTVEEWRMPTNQMAMVSHIYFAGNLMCTNPRLNFKMTALSS